jgi:leader peptidase (prepilin peptidase) / N-methyltransferase
MIPQPYDWLVPVLAAPFIGSFLSVLAVRLPKGEDVVAAPSHCRACNRALKPLELIPLASFAIQGGKCRGCGAELDSLYPLMELSAVGVALWAAFVVQGELLWITAALGWALLALIAMDLRDFVLADVITLPLVLAGLAVAWWIDPAALAWHVLGAALGFGLMAAAASGYKLVRGRDGLGFGDAKLMAAAGAWTGLEGFGAVLLYGAVTSLALVIAWRLAGRTIDAATPIPLGAGLAAGLWLVWLYGPLVLGA